MYKGRCLTFAPMRARYSPMMPMPTYHSKNLFETIRFFDIFEKRIVLLNQFKLHNMRKTFFWMAMMAFVFSACSKKLESCFTYTVAAGTVTFNSGCAENATEFAWDFGDGSTATQPTPIHTYAAAGNYQVTLVVKDAKGKKSALSSQFVTVTAVPCNPACVNGLCVDGDCICNAGYEGADCSTAFNAKFSGIYTLSETCTSGADSYSVTASPSSTDPSKATFSGLYRENVGVTAQIGTTGLSFTIARQPIFTGYEIEGTIGTINASGNTINISYRIWSNATNTVVDNCTATLAK
jgi:PKD repeat protein